MSFRFLRTVLVFITALLCSSHVAASPLRVCADPDNLPYSNRALQGYENKVAALLARDLGRKLEYKWARMGRGFIREVLNGHECDVLIEVPKGFPPVLTTPSYFTSSYMFITRKSRHLEVHSFDDDWLRTAKIGLQVLDDDYAPPAQALARRGVVGNIVGFESDSDGPEKIVEAVAQGKIDVAIVWGPLAGYYAKRQRVPLQLTPVPAVDQPGIPFTYAISMGVRKSDRQLQSQLADFLERKKRSIDLILHDYGVPVVDSSQSNAMLIEGKR